MEWTTITDIILIISIITLGVFAVLGLYQWITRKSLKKVDKQLLWMPLPIVLMVLVYLVCDKVLPHLFPNFMPTRPDGSGEYSFPSTHVMVVTTIFFCVSAAMSKYIKSKAMLITLDIIMFALASLMATGRIISNKHSFIDVIGAIAFAFVFYEIYYACYHHKKTKKEKLDV